MKPVAEFAVLTGLRTTNIRELVWGRVHLERAHTWIPAQSTKGGRAIGIALSDDAVRVLSDAYGKAAWRKAWAWSARRAN